MQDSKSPIQSLGIMGPAGGIAVWVINKVVPGLGVGPGDVQEFINLASPPGS